MTHCFDQVFFILFPMQCFFVKGQYCLVYLDIASVLIVGASYIINFTWENKLSNVVVVAATSMYHLISPRLSIID